ncbi:MAG: tetratricopeptide repeat protein [Casimicrobiaceae bacterium]
MPATANQVTFLFTDIEGSTRLWETDPVRMASALERHDRLCRTVVQAHGGVLVKMIGDGLHAAFTDSSAALLTALQLQRGLAAIVADHGIAFRMRCGLHAGVAQVRDDDYFGGAVNRAARIMAAAHGGQVLLSQAVVDSSKGRLPAGTDLVSLGRVRLRDLANPEDIWQLTHPDLSPDFPPLRSLDSTPNNLPGQLTSFVGRFNEVAEVKRLLRETRLLTLTGAGGCGKTRLSLQVAADMLEDYADGVRLVELAALSDPGLLPQTVASVLGLKEQPGKTLTQTVIERIAARRLLLILDNAEHLLVACGDLVGDLLDACPELVVLTSSREPLRVRGELTFRVPPMPTPDPKRDVTPEQLSPFESVRLFVERARLNTPHFSVTPQNAPALASVCHRLDGIPLAIELAAARVRAMSIEQLDQRLDQRFRLITGISRTAPRRQQTLQALIDWSYDLLNDAEKALLCRASAFAAGWTLEAAEKVCVGEGVEDWEVLGILTSLTDKNLVVTEERSETIRYRLLETVRQYARERLVESSDEQAVGQRHRDCFLALAEHAEGKLNGGEQVRWLQRLEDEHENLRAGLGFSVAESGSQAGLRLCGALQRFWITRGHVSEGRGWCERLIGKAGGDDRTPERAKVLNAASALAYYQGDYRACRALSEESLAIRRELGDQKGTGVSLNNLGLLALEHGDFASARACLDESLAIKRELGDVAGMAASLNNLGNLTLEQGDFARARVRYAESLSIMRGLGDRTGIGNALNNLGTAALEQGDHAAASAALEESLAVRRALGNPGGISKSLHNLGMVAFEQGKLAAAKALYEESLTIDRELGDKRGIVFTLEELAAVVAAMGAPLRAACVWGSAEQLREEIGSPLPLSDRPRYERAVAAARGASGDDLAFERAREEGRQLGLEEGIGRALADSEQL